VAPEFTPGFKWGSCYSIFSFMCMFWRSLFVLLYFFFWPLCCLFFFDIRILITPLVSSNSSNRPLPQQCKTLLENIYNCYNYQFMLCVMSINYPNIYTLLIKWKTKIKIPHWRNSSKIPHCRNSSKIPHCQNSSKIPHCRNSSKIPHCRISSTIY